MSSKGHLVARGKIKLFIPFTTRLMNPPWCTCTSTLWSLLLHGSWPSGGSIVLALVTALSWGSWSILGLFAPCLSRWGCGMGVIQGLQVKSCITCPCLRSREGSPAPFLDVTAATLSLFMPLTVGSSRTPIKSAKALCQFTRPSPHGGSCLAASAGTIFLVPCFSRVAWLFLVAMGWGGVVVALGMEALKRRLSESRLHVALMALLFPLALLLLSQRLRGPSRPSVRWPAGRSR